MSKYSPLSDYLARQTATVVKLSFAEVEALLGAPLARTARVNANWWCNEDPAKTRHVQCRAWAGQGFRAEVKMARRVVWFYRCLAAPEPGRPRPAEPPELRR